MHPTQRGSKFKLAGLIRENREIWGKRREDGWGLRKGWGHEKREKRYEIQGWKEFTYKGKKGENKPYKCSGEDLLCETSAVGLGFTAFDWNN